MRTFYYGPPAAGKSTMIRRLSAQGVPSLDCESLWPSAGSLSAKRQATISALQLSLARDPSIRAIGAAGLDVTVMKALYPDDEHVLLLPPRAVYDLQRRKRDQSEPSKAAQPDVYDEFSNSRSLYTRVL